MICSNCGAECGDNQAFCPKCGNPIQLMADFNLIEKELASNIDEFMAEIENEKGQQQQTEENEEFEEMKTIDVPLEEINMELKVVDISRNHPTTVTPDISGLDDDDDEDDISPVYIPDRKSEKSENRRKQQNKKKLYAIIAGGIAAVLVIVLAIVFIMSNGAKDGNGGQKDFSYYYTEAENSYESGNLDNALDMALKAVENSKNDNDEKKARMLILSIYEKQNYYGEYYLRNLEELYYKGDNSEENCLKLIRSYMANQDIEGFLRLYSSIDEDTVRTYMGDKFVEKPSSNVQQSEYKNRVGIELSAEAGCRIYYVLGSLEDTSPVEYTGTIEITEVGSYEITAYAVSNEDVMSYPAQFSFTVVEGVSDGPDVTPAGGTYYEPTKITIEVPQGSKAYYTCDGTVPSESSAEYTEPFDMPRGISEVKVIVVDEYGNRSDVSSVQYNLKLPRNETVNSGKDKVWEHYYSNGMIDADGYKADGSVIEISYYDAVEINNVEYYIYQVIDSSEDGAVTGIAYIAVNTYDGTVEADVIQAGDEFVITKTGSGEQ